MTVPNSPNPSRVYIRLCKPGRRFLVLKYNKRTAPPPENESSSFFQALNMLGNPRLSQSVTRNAFPFPPFNIQVIPVVNSLVGTVRDSLEKQVLA